MPLSEKQLWIYLLATLAVKMALAHVLPMTGDEVYFIEWGRHLDYGYYDHTPMVGWLLSAMLAVDDSALWLRLPQILITSFIGWAIYWLLHQRYPSMAVMAAVLYLIAPINVLGVLITTDTPLIFWSFLSAVCFYRAQRHDHSAWYLLAGVFLGLAFFSKFFAGLLGVAYVLYTMLFVRRGLKPYLGLLLIVAGTLPFIFLNLLWNYNHCWDNYLFNLMNRTAGSQFSLAMVWKYLLLLVYLVTPPVIYYLVKERFMLRSVLSGGTEGVFLGLFLLPIGLFLLLSFWVSIGLHWLLSFYPFVFLALAPVLSSTALRKCFYFMLPFSVLHVFAIAVVLILAPGIFKDNENTYKDVVYGMYSTEIVSQIDKRAEGYILATDSYTESALLSYAAKRHVIVLGMGSHHARQDDLITDFRELDGKNIVMVSYSSKLDIYRPFFKEMEIKTLPIAETEYYYLLGRGFNYKAYREQIIEKILTRYYRVPEFLPLGACYMHERYGKPSEQSKVR